MTDTRNLRRGDRIVLTSGRRWSMPFERPWLTTGAHVGLHVVKFDSVRDDMITYVPDGGEKSEAKIHQFAWLGHLPDLPEEQTIAFIGACLNAKDAPVLLHVRRKHHGEMLAVAIDVNSTQGLPQYGLISDLLDVRIDDIHVEEGDLLIAMGNAIAFTDGVAVHTFAHAEVIRKRASTIEAQMLFAQPPVPRLRRARVASLGEIDRRRQLAWADQQPDQAIVLVTAQGYTFNTIDILASGGRTICESDDPASDLGSFADEGLWMLRNVRWWQSEDHEGGKDGGMTADWSPCEENDAASFGLTIGDIGDRARRRDQTGEMDHMDGPEAFMHYALKAKEREIGEDA